MERTLHFRNGAKLSWGQGGQGFLFDYLVTAWLSGLESSQQSLARRTPVMVVGWDAVEAGIGGVLLILWVGVGDCSWAFEIPRGASECQWERALG